MEAEQGAIVAGTLPDNRAAVVLAQDRSSLGMIRVELRAAQPRGLTSAPRITPLPQSSPTPLFE